LRWVRASRRPATGTAGADPLDQSIKFWDRIAERYAKQPIADEAAYRKKLEVTRQYLRADMEILEFGCGTGSTAILHAPYVKRIHAIDVSSKMLQIAKHRAEAKGIHNITFERAAIESIRVPDCTFDSVLGLNILHLVEDRAGVIAKVHKMLKPGGRFVTSTPCIGDTMKWFKTIAPIGAFFGLMPSVKVFTTKELERNLVDGDFEIEYRWQPRKGKAVFIVAKKSG
jgi:ubiquinone/menaquinone biosynthesis C-methylase UbiE